MSTNTTVIESAKRIQDMEFPSEEMKAEILNIIEKLCKEINELRIENQELVNEVMRLKGEKGKPEIKPNKPEEKKVSQNQERWIKAKRRNGKKAVKKIK